MTTNLGLHEADLHNIANVLEQLRKTGVLVETAVIGDFRVTLEWHTETSARNDTGDYYTVRTIERCAVGL